MRARRGAPQAALIAELNPVIRGWMMRFAYRACVAKEAFSKLDHLVFEQLCTGRTFATRTNGMAYRTRVPR